jgi:hypothetical protein
MRLIKCNHIYIYSDLFNDWINEELKRSEESSDYYREFNLKQNTKFMCLEIINETEDDSQIIEWVSKLINDKFPGLILIRQ